MRRPAMKSTFYLSLLLGILPTFLANETPKQHTPKFHVMTLRTDNAEGPAAAIGGPNGDGDEPHYERVVYYLDKDYVITDGDICLGKLGDVKKLRVPSSEAKAYWKSHGKGGKVVKKKKRAISIFPQWVDNRWPDATLTYKYNDAAAEEQLTPVVDMALHRWKEAVPWLTFKKLPASAEGVNGVMTIIMTSGAGSCWAPIGWSSLSPLTMQLDLLNCNVDTYVHEFGHALGLYHEHQRPDRDDYMHFDCTALQDYWQYGTDASSCPGEPMKCCRDESCWGWACAFTKLGGLFYDGPLDTKSIMMYREYSFSAGVSKTLEGRNGHQVSPNDNPYPSEGDKKRICEIYHEKCKSTPDDPEPPVEQICGNGIKEGTEECDDGGTIDGDGCSSKCTIEHIPPGSECRACNPDPRENRCDITTSCITTQPGGTHYCACRAGYKANPGYEKMADGLAQWRLPFGGQEYRVFVKPGVICDALCDNWSGSPDVQCNEVETKESCSAGGGGSNSGSGETDTAEGGSYRHRKKPHRKPHKRPHRRPHHSDYEDEDEEYYDYESWY